MAVRPPLTFKPAKQAEPEPPPVPEPAAKRPAKSYRSPSRVGKRAAVAWLEPEAVKQLNMVAILEGVKAGEQVVTSGQLKLQPGATIKVDNSGALKPPAELPKQ